MEAIGCHDQYRVSGSEKGLMGNNEYVSRAPPYKDNKIEVSRIICN
jgi:hypothetical protein